MYAEDVRIFFPKFCIISTLMEEKKNIMVCLILKKEKRRKKHRTQHARW